MFLLPLVFAQSPVVTPYAQQANREIRNITLSAPAVPQFERIEAVIDLAATYDNPFDPDDIAVDAIVQPPTGTSYEVPAYFDRKWKVRIAPTQLGDHAVTIRMKDRTGISTRSFHFNATPPIGDGFIGISPRDRRYFEFSDGKPYFPIGTNLAFSRQGVDEYDRWLPALGKSGGNYARIWLSPPWATFGLQSAGKARDGKGVDQFDLQKAADLDRVLDTAAENGVSVMLTLDTYNVLRIKDREPYWDKSPYNADNGGPLRIWSDFWSSDAMRKAYQMKLRYLVARYGAMRNIFAWELWNEVDLTSDFNPMQAREWHNWAASRLRKIDPYDHLITTSVSQTMGIREVDQAPEIDFVQTHHYGAVNPAGTIASQQGRKATWGKPHLISEIGVSATGPMADVDPTGIQFRDPMWAAMATGTAGSAMPWWWDNYIDAENLYYRFSALAKFVKEIDFPAENFQPVRPLFSFAPRVKAPRRDLKMDGKRGVWGPHNLNRPRTYVYKDGKMSSLAVSEIQHGVGAHPDWHNPILFRLYLPKPVKLEVELNRVSGYGGATLRIELDGNRYMTREFVDPDGLADTHDLTQYAGIYSVVIPAGYHTMKVENVGADWFSATYRFVGLLPPVNKPAVEAYAMIGNELVLAFVRPDTSSWQRIALMKQKPTKVPPTTMRLKGLAAGRWAVQHWDTDRGLIIRETSTLVGFDGVMRVSLPEITGNVALKVIRRTKTR